MIHTLKLSREVNYTGAGGVVEGVKFALNPGEDLGAEEVPDVNMLVDLPPNTDNTVGWVQFFGTVTVSGGQLSISGGSLSDTVALSNAPNIGDVYEITVNTASTIGDGYTVSIFDTNNNNITPFINTPGTQSFNITILEYNSPNIVISTFATGGSAVINAILVKKLGGGSEEEVTATHIPTQTFPSELIGFEVPWTVDPVLDDVVEFRYDGAGNYVDKSQTKIGMQDNFTGVSAPLNGRLPDTVDNQGILWLGSSTPVIDGAGNVRNPTTTNNLQVHYIVDTISPVVTVQMSFEVGAVANENFGIIIRGTQASDLVYAELKTNAAGGSIRMVDRVSSSNTLVDEKALITEPRGNILTFIISDFGDRIEFYCVEDNLTSTITTAQMTLPADNSIGIFFQNTNGANDAFVLNMVEGLDAPLAEQTVELKNCINSNMFNFFTENTGTVLENFTDFSHIAVVDPIRGSAALDNVTFLNNGVSMKATVFAGQSNSDAREDTITPPRDLSFISNNDYIGCWVYFPRDTGGGVPDIDELILFLSSDDVFLLNYYSISSSQLTSSNMRAKGWHFVGAPKADFTVTGTPDWANIRSIRYRIDNNAGSEAFVNVSSLIAAPAPTAICMLSFDDNDPSVIAEAHRIMAPLGLVGTNYVTKDRIAEYGPPGGMSLANIATLAAAGWSNGNHYTTHTSATTVPLATAKVMIGECQSFMNGLGYDGDHVAYVGGQRNVEVMQMVRDELGIKTARLANTTWNNGVFDDVSSSKLLDPVDIYNIPSYQLGASITLATAKAWVDEAVADKRFINIYAHALVTTPITENEWAIADYQELCDYIKAFTDAGTLKNMTMKTWYDRRFEFK